MARHALKSKPDHRLDPVSPDPRQDAVTLHASDMQVSDDGHGNALLTFPDGNSITVVGIAPMDLTLRDALAAIAVSLPNDTDQSDPQDSSINLAMARTLRDRLNHF